MNQQAPKIVREEPFEFNVLEYIGLLRKHFKTIALAGFLGALISIALYSSKPKIYRATAIIKVDPVQQDSLDFGDGENWLFGMYYFRTEFMNTEFEEMQSNPVLDRVIDKLGLEFFDEAFPAKKSSFSVMSLIRRKPANVEPMTPEQELEHKRKVARRKLLAGIDIKERRATLLINVAFQAQKPGVAQQIVNAWVDAYIDNDLDKDYQRNLEALNFVESSLKEVQDDTAELVARKTVLEQDLDIVKVGNNANIEDESVVRLNQTLIQAENDWIMARSNLEKLRESNPEDSIEVSENNLVSDLQRQLSGKENELKVGLRTYSDQFPRMKALQREVDSLKTQLGDTRTQVFNDLVADYRADVRARHNTYDRLKERLDEQKESSVVTRGELQKEIADIETQIAVNRRMSERLNSQQEDFGIALSLRDIRRTDKDIMQLAGLPTSPAAPSLKKHLAVGLALGLMLSIAAVFLIEITDRKIYTPDMLQKATGLNTLSMVPRIRDRTLGKSAKGFKLQTLKKVAGEWGEAMNASIGKKHVEVGQMLKVAGQALGQDEEGISQETLQQDLLKIRALASRLLKLGVRTPELAEVYLTSGYAATLGDNIEDDAAADRKRRAGKTGLNYTYTKKAKKSKPKVEADEVAYGADDETDAKYGIRRVVGCFTHIKPVSPFAEAYRHLRTTLQYANTNELKIMLLTSSVPGEGKTISSINLAIAFSQLGKKVLLVDGDLRRSKLHKVFRLTNDCGMVNYLVGKDDDGNDVTSLEQCTKQTFIPNLHLLSAGSQAPNPAELLASNEMKKLVNEMRETFDHVIFDSSPVLAVTDSCIVGNLADATLFVSKASKTNRDEAHRATQLLRANKIEPIGALFNDIDQRGKMGYSKYGYGGYGYGYGGYGYGYGYSYTPDKA